MYRNFIKPVLDVLFAIVALILLSPVIVILAFALLLSQRTNPFFTQKRIGYNCKAFTLIKFRTMSNQKDDQGNLLPDNLRLTKIGRLVRSTSLDEIPQLFNMVKGDMSLIGPRPLLVKYLPLYSDRQRRRHEVKPGVTGWAQINGRNSIDWSEKFELDVYYVDNLSWRLDARIFWRTIVKVLKRDGISGQGTSTMKPFVGNKN